MNMDLNRKIGYLDTNQMLGTDELNRLFAEMQASPALERKQGLQVKKFRDAAMTLAYYRDRLNGNAAENAPVVSAKDAETAWKTLKGLSETLSEKYHAENPAFAGRTPEETALAGRYALCALSFREMFATQTRHEAQLRNVPENVQIFAVPEVEDTYFRAQDALPYLDNLNKTAPADAMRKLSGSAVLRNRPELQFDRFSRGVEDLSAFAKAPSPELVAGAANAFADFREHANDVIGAIDRMLPNTANREEYEALREYRAVLMQYDHAVSCTDASKKARLFREDRKHFAAVREETRNMFAVEDDERSASIGLEEEEELSPSEERYSALFTELTDYRNHIRENVFETAFPALEQQIAEKKRAIPEEVLRAFSNCNSIKQLCEMEQSAEQQMKKRDPGNRTPEGMYPEYVRQITELRMLEAKEAILADADPARFAHYEQQAEERMNKLPDAALHSRICALAEQLNAMHKFGRNTEEFRQFRDALNNAAQTGDCRALLDVSKKYITLKTAGGKMPSSANGLARLSIAQAVNDLLTRTEENQVLASLPTEEEEEILQEQSEIEQHSIDFSFVEQVFDNNEAQRDTFADIREEAEAEVPVVEEAGAAEEAVQADADVPASREISDEQAAALGDLPAGEHLDTLRWMPRKQGAEPSHDVFRRTLERDLYNLPEELRASTRETVYGLIERHLTGRDINGPVNFLRACKKELFEGKDGQPPILDQKKHMFYANNLLQTVLLYSDFPQRQAEQFRSMLPSCDPDGRGPLLDTPLIPESEPKTTQERALLARQHMEEKIRQTAMTRILSYPDPEYGRVADACFYGYLEEKILTGDQQRCAAIMKLSDEQLRELENIAPRGEGAFSLQLERCLEHNAEEERNFYRNARNAGPARQEDAVQGSVPGRGGR